MSTASSDIKRSKRPGQSGVPIMVRLQPDQLAALDRWISENDATLTRPAAIRAILEKAIT